MTDCALATPAPTRGATRETSRETSRATSRATSRRAARRARRALPGVPSWTRLLGVTTVPVGPPDPHDPHGPQAWVISAGVGTGHIAALVHTSPDAEGRRGH